MPTYNFQRISTGEEWSEYMSMSRLDEVLEDKDIKQLPTAPPIISGVSQKPNDGFRDILKRIKSNHIYSNINTF